MENASKALIIAGAILLAILLISLGIMVFNQSQDAISNSGMSKAEISSFNSQFTKYEGDQKGSTVKSLINEVNASNASDKSSGNGRTITVTIDGTEKGENPSTSDVTSTATYNVTMTYDKSSGYVDTITITNKANKKTTGTGSGS